MEEQPLDSTFVLKVNINCCKACPSKLKKALLKINGVYSVSVDTENKLVSVTGKVDPTALIKSIAKMGKKAQLFSHANDSSGSDQKDKRSDTESGKNDGYKSSEQDCCCNDFEHKVEDYVPPPVPPRQAPPPRRETSNHQAEDYVPPPPPPEFAEHICKDPYCKIHRREGFIRERVVPPREHEVPHHRYPPWMPPAAAAGGYERLRPMPGMDNYGRGYMDENRSCSIM